MRVTPNGLDRHDPGMDDPFPVRLRDARQRAGLSMNKLAHRINVETDKGYNETNVRRWEHGVGWPHASTVPVIATILGVTTDYLYGLTDNPHGQSDALGPLGR